MSGIAPLSSCVYTDVIMMLVTTHCLLTRCNCFWVMAGTTSISFRGPTFWSRIVLPASVFVALLVLAGIAALVARKMLSPADKDAPGFSLHELKEMHRRGQLTDVEYRSARDSLIANMTTDRNE